jgi:hypothetical protein
MFVRAHIGVLDYALSFAVISQNGPCHAVKALVVTAHDDFENCPLARQNADHNFLITQRLLRSGGFRWAQPTRRQKPRVPICGASFTVLRLGVGTSGRPERWPTKPWYHLLYAFPTSLLSRVGGRLLRQTPQTPTHPKPDSSLGTSRLHRDSRTKGRIREFSELLAKAMRSNGSAQLVRNLFVRIVARFIGKKRQSVRQRCPLNACSSSCRGSRYVHRKSTSWALG